MKCLYFSMADISLFPVVRNPTALKTSNILKHNTHTSKNPFAIRKVRLELNLWIKLERKNVYIPKAIKLRSQIDR